MKEITIQVDDNLLKGLNNAVAAYGDIVFALMMNCDVPLKFQKLQSLSEDELLERHKAVSDLYYKIERELVD